jgi:serine/threonine protein kinase
MSESLAGVLLDKRFRVESVIGNAHAGGMVYRGRDITSNVPVVIRCPAVPTNLAPDELERAFDDFLTEAVLLASVCQATTDVERLLASGVELSTRGRAPFCVFEWLAGRSLERDLRDRKSGLSIGEAIVILEPAARALMAAHALGAAHKDVRPANLWLAEHEGTTRLKLAAFGLATRLGPGPTAFAPEYAAPEHFKASYGATGPQTDVYGLGLTLVEMIAGRRALEGADPGELYLATSDLAKRPTLRARGAHVSDAVEGVVARALAVDPRRRFQNVREMWDALLSAVPELTPAPPSTKNKAAEPVPLASSPPGIVAGSGSPITFKPSQPPPAPSAPPTADARLESGAVKAYEGPPPGSSVAPPKRDRSGAGAWLVVAALGVAAIGVVVAKVGGTAPHHPPPPPPPKPSASAPPKPSAEAAVDVKPFLEGMVPVPAGPKVPRAFYIDRLEVTAEAYAGCVDEKACTPNKVHGDGVVETTAGCNGKDKPRHPANCVDRAQAAKFCAWAGKRLPTEAEWEYAARGNDGREYPWGNAAPTSCKQAILTGMQGECGERKGTWEVGTTTEGKSPFGAFDMAGNVWEWVDADADGGGAGILRGGSWDYATTSAKTTYRLSFPASGGNVSIGFRCATSD